MNDALSAPVVAPSPAEWQDWPVADIVRGCAGERAATGSRRHPFDPIRLPSVPRGRAHDREVSIGFALHDPNVARLADVGEGGETVFPSLHRSIRPRAGSAAYFEYCDRHGEVDPRCLHAGAPVKRGEKWIATKWLRQSPYRPPN